MYGLSHYSLFPIGLFLPSSEFPWCTSRVSRKFSFLFSVLASYLPCLTARKRELYPVLLSLVPVCALTRKIVEGGKVGSG